MQVEYPQIDLWGKYKGSSGFRFYRFHKANPQVYQALKTMAFRALNKGKTKYSIRALWEIARWEDVVECRDPNQDTVKMNDHYVPHYARLLMENEPELEGFFDLRKLRGEKE